MTDERKQAEEILECEWTKVYSDGLIKYCDSLFKGVFTFQQSGL